MEDLAPNPPSRSFVVILYTRAPPCFFVRQVRVMRSIVEMQEPGVSKTGASISAIPTSSDCA